MLGCPPSVLGIFNSNISKVNAATLKRQAIDIAGNATETDAGYIPADAPSINASAAIVMDIDTGDILYEKKSHDHYYPAGMTKVVTAMVSMEQANMNDTITISENVMNQITENTSVVGFKLGEVISVRDAVYSIMFAASTDASLALSEHIAGSSSDFAELMNKRIEEMGLKDTHFTNSTGIQNEDHYTSAYDMAIIGRQAYQYPEFRTMISSLSYTIPKTNKRDEYTLWTENLQIYGSSDYFYKYCTGGKTGYTDAALFTLMSFVERDGRRLVSVVMKCDTSSDMYYDTRNLCNFCFDNYRLCKPLLNYNINKDISKDNSLLDNYYSDLNHDLPIYYVNQNYSFYVRSNVDDSMIEKNIELSDTIINNNAGKISFYYNGTYYGESDIEIDIPLVEASSTDAIKKVKDEPGKKIIILDILKILIPVIIILILFILVLVLIKKIRKELQLHHARSNAKYFPIKRDTRLYPKKDKKKNNNNKSDDNKSDDSNKDSDNQSNKDLNDDKEKESVLNFKEFTISKDAFEDNYEDF